jgi:uncharacterized protein YkwD
MFLSVLLSIIVFSCSPKPPAKPATTVTSKPTEVSTTAKTSTKRAPVTLASMESSILQEVNKHRVSRGLAPLVANSILDTEASMHSQQMASKQVPFGHDGYATRMARISQRLGGIKSSAENVAYGKMNAKEVVAAWLKSAQHKKNIEGNYNLSGIGISRNTQGIIYYTQIFSKQ